MMKSSLPRVDRNRVWRSCQLKESVPETVFPAKAVSGSQAAAQFGQIVLQLADGLSQFSHFLLQSLMSRFPLLFFRR
jgi:hypothetical protein